MKCDRCGKENVFTKVVVQTPEKTEELNLCPECFAEFIAEHPEIKSGMEEDVSKMMGDLFPGMLKKFPKNKNLDPSSIFGKAFFGKSLKKNHNHNTSHKMCKTCQTTIESIKNTNTVGCQDCYKLFKDEINQIILQNSGENLETQTDIRETTKEEKLKILEMTLSDAVEAEMYELAAQVRDDINLLKKD